MPAAMRCLLEILESRLNDDDGHSSNGVSVTADVAMYDYHFVVDHHYLLDYLDFEINVNLNDAMVDV